MARHATAMRERRTFFMMSSFWESVANGRTNADSSSRASTREEQEFAAEDVGYRSPNQFAVAGRGYSVTRAACLGSVELSSLQNLWHPA